eukprot:scaffold5612_cov25-Tisochrysis_lutea.AAC.2
MAAENAVEHLLAMGVRDELARRLRNVRFSGLISHGARPNRPLRGGDLKYQEHLGRVVLVVFLDGVEHAYGPLLIKLPMLPPLPQAVLVHP